MSIATLIGQNKHKFQMLAWTVWQTESYNYKFEQLQTTKQELYSCFLSWYLDIINTELCQPTKPEFKVL